MFAGTKSKLTKALEKFDESSHLVEVCGFHTCQP